MWIYASPLAQLQSIKIDSSKGSKKLQGYEEAGKAKGVPMVMCELGIQSAAGAPSHPSVTRPL